MVFEILKFEVQLNSKYSMGIYLNFVWMNFKALIRNTSFLKCCKGGLKPVFFSFVKWNTFWGFVVLQKIFWIHGSYFFNMFFENSACQFETPQKNNNVLCHCVNECIFIENILYVVMRYERIHGVLIIQQNVYDELTCNFIYVFFFTMFKIFKSYFFIS